MIENFMKGFYDSFGFMFSDFTLSYLGFISGLLLMLLFVLGLLGSINFIIKKINGVQK